MTGPLHDSRNPNPVRAIRKPEHVHQWDGGKEIGRTGDWFHPLIVEFRCPCGATKTEDV